MHTGSEQVGLETLIEQLSRPGAYPHPVESVEVVQTHASVVFVAGDYAYKLKKPVDFGFLDYSTRPLREQYCRAEVRLNRRLAEPVYLGVVSVLRGPNGELRFGADGDRDVALEPIEPAVKMRRLDHADTLESRVVEGTAVQDDIVAVARRIAGFHREARRDSDIAHYGAFDVVAGNCRENFEQLGPLVPDLPEVPPVLFDALASATETALRDARGDVEARARAGLPCDTHGDLRLEHVYLYPAREPPDDIWVVDCIEFNERFRYADPVADIAFLAMDLMTRGAWDLAEVLERVYFEAAADPRGRDLLPLYVAYRATVRAKVEAMKAMESEVPASDRARARRRARAHLLVALGALRPPRARPALVLVAGLPGTGKSTLARSLADTLDMAVVRADVVRKELAGIDPRTPAPAGVGAGIYTPAFSDRTYAACRDRAIASLARGGRVIVDANFKEDHRRREFVEAARGLGVPVAILVCEADADLVRARIRGRRGDASDADVDVYEHARHSWEPLGPLTGPVSYPVETTASPDECRAKAVDLLVRARMA